MGVINSFQMKLFGAFQSKEYSDVLLKADFVRRFQLFVGNCGCDGNIDILGYIYASWVCGGVVH